jgi:uncharacterized membrane protein
VIQDQQQSSFGLSPNVAAGIASLFSWAGGLVILLGKPPQAWVRFVAVQAIVLAVAYAVLWVAIVVVNMMLGLAHLWPLMAITGIVGLIGGLAFFVCWVIATIQAFTGKAWRIPVIAQYADRYVPASQSL